MPTRRLLFGMIATLAVFAGVLIALDSQTEPTPSPAS